MAWTSKGDRFHTIDKSSSTPDRLGPGAYLGHQSHTHDVSYAPFGSTKLRTEPGYKMGGAAPGSYDPKLPGKGSYDGGLPRPHVPFGASGDQRPVLKVKGISPGPGDYQLDPDRPKPQASRTMGEAKRDNHRMFRSTSAPSIPQAHQSYGYEEIGGGRLKLQAPRSGVTYLTGRTDDSAGPGHYEIQNSVGSGGPGIRFGQCDRSGPLKDTGVPGPGHYVSRSEQRGHIQRAPAVSSSFVSQSDHRPNLKGGKDSPGPGSYQVTGNKPTNLREIHAELQYFGSTVERFHAGPSATGPVPGPGQYEGVPKRLRPSLKPFCSSSGRFKPHNLTKIDTPGPGSYDPALESSTSGPTGTVSILGAMGGLAFGSMERRGGPVPKGIAEYPGPGAYHDGGAEAASDTELDSGKNSRAAVRRTRPPSYAFKSATPKDVMTKNTVKMSATSPPPGAYDPRHARDCTTVVRMPPKGEGFLGGAARFTYRGASDLPGPGEYKPEMVTGGKRLDTFNRTVVEGVPRSGRPQGMGFASQAKRFEGETSSGAKRTSPGPGAYNTDPGWVKKTHNIYFGDVV
eukprot:TRINITY_DN31223_c0_g1_i1.p1 TRINITY_DN31223_c0_g1~~TRINITY_DN31223_c0_g1_i1.p1  ORF type:complete len:568 (+),score=50.87 TRINITY_DN31223_c0_g1_i1:106-1809(+)